MAFKINWVQFEGNLDKMYTTDAIRRALDNYEKREYGMLCPINGKRTIEDFVKEYLYKKE
jgi:hypothetical protein